MILQLLVPVLDLGLLRYLRGSLEPVWGLELVGAISSARLRVKLVCLGALTFLVDVGNQFRVR